MIRPILRYGERPLHEPAAEVATFDDGLERLIDDMIETMYAAPGIGLAATQLGVPLRVFVVDISVGRERDGLIVMVNPGFVEREGMQLEEEGCLSVPGFNATVVRPQRTVLKGLDRAWRRANGRRKGSSRARLPARDGSSRWRPVHRSSPRNQAGPHRPSHSEAETQRTMVTPQSGQRLRIVYFGTPEFAVPTLQRLVDLGGDLGGPDASAAHQVVALVSQPDRPKGRGHQLAPTPTKTLALTRGIPVLQPERLKDEAFLSQIAGFAPDLGVVAAYGKLLPDAAAQHPAARHD